MVSQNNIFGFILRFNKTEVIMDGEIKNEETKEIKNEKGSKTSKVFVLLIAAGIAMVAFNQVNVLSLESRIDNIAAAKPIQKAVSFKENTFAVTLTGDTVSDAINAVIPTGVAPYGNGDLSYDDVNGGIQLLKGADIGIPTESLTEEQLKRYISIASRISCEYCCSAKSIIFNNGQSACGCAHSYALRGLAKYLIIEYEDEYTDDEILFEMTKWKNLFFPKFTVQKAQR